MKSPKRKLAAMLETYLKALILEYSNRIARPASSERTGARNVLIIVRGFLSFIILKKAQSKGVALERLISILFA